MGLVSRVLRQGVALARTQNGRPSRRTKASQRVRMYDWATPGPQSKQRNRPGQAGGGPEAVRCTNR